MPDDPGAFANQPPAQPNAYGPAVPGTGESSLKRQKLSHYDIYDRHEKKTVGRAKTLASALRSVDRRDNQHGGYRYTHKAVYQDE